MERRERVNGAAHDPKLVPASRRASPDRTLRSRSRPPYWSRPTWSTKRSRRRTTTPRQATARLKLPESSPASAERPTTRQSWAWSTATRSWTAKTLLRGVTDEAAPKSERDAVSTLWTRVLGAGGVRWRRARARRDLLAAMPRRRARAMPRAKPVVIALLALGLVGVGAEAFTRLTSGSAPVRSTGAAVSGASLEPLTSGLLSSVGNPLAEAHTTRRAHRDRPRRARPRRATAKHPEARKAVGSSPVPARYTPPSSSRNTGSASSNTGSASSNTGSASSNTGSGSSSTGSGSSSTPGYRTSGSTAGTAAQPAAQTSASSSTPKTSAFGSAGALGPGSSPNG